jgi:hypothetical protein
MQRPLPVAIPVGRPVLRPFVPVGTDPVRDLKLHQLLKDTLGQGLQKVVSNSVVAKRREKLSRALGKRALKTCHPRSFNVRLLAGVTWSDQSGTHSRTAAPAFC